MVNAGLFLKHELQANQKQVGQDRLSHMMMPPQPCPRFILIHSHFSLTFFQSRLDGPAQAADTHEFLQGTGEGRIAQKKT
jgi:hypothetical protein